MAAWLNKAKTAFSTFLATHDERYLVTESGLKLVVTPGLVWTLSDRAATTWGNASRTSTSWSNRTRS